MEGLIFGILQYVNPGLISSSLQYCEKFLKTSLEHVNVVGKTCCHVNLPYWYLILQIFNYSCFLRLYKEIAKLKISKNKSS